MGSFYEIQPLHIRRQCAFCLKRTVKKLEDNLRKCAWLPLYDRGSHAQIVKKLRFQLKNSSKRLPGRKSSKCNT